VRRRLKLRRGERIRYPGGGAAGTARHGVGQAGTVG
jgi:hypothetical protein